VIAHVVLLMMSSAGRDGDAEQLVIAPVVDGVCVAAMPAVSMTVEGVKLTVGLAASTDNVRPVLVEPVLLLTVIV
jgi:hypothetical protein